MPSPPVDKVLVALEEHGSRPQRSGTGWSACCPAHEDRNPSLKIDEAEDGKALVHCHAMCPTPDVVAAIGLKMADLMPPPAAGRTSGKRRAVKPKPTFTSAKAAVCCLEQKHGANSGIYVYRSAAGDPLGAVVRFDRPEQDDKDFFALRCDGRSWTIQGMPEPRPLYGLDRLAGRALQTQVIIVEGERKADLLREFGILAITSPHGARSALKADWRPLGGLDVPPVIWPDNDDAGEEYAGAVAKALAALDPPVRASIVRPPGLPPSGDAVDFIRLRREAGDSDEDIRAQIATLIEGADSFLPPIERERGRFEFNPVPITELPASASLDWILKGYIARGHTTLFTALWKSGKTTWVTHLVRGLQHGGGFVGQAAGIRILIVTEESAELWRRRQEEHDLGPSLLIQRQPFLARPNHHDWQAFVGCLAEFVSTHGIDLVIIDTVAKIWPVADENSAADVGAALTPFDAVTRAGAGLLLVHHPRKGDASEGQASRGSGALPAAVDVIMEMRRLQAQDRADRRRVISTYSRFDETPVEAVLELTDDGYMVVGDKATVKHDERLTIIESILPIDGDGMTPDEVLEEWPNEPAPGKTCVRQDLNAGAGTRWERLGDGKRGNPHRYRRSIEFVSSTVPLLDGRNETRHLLNGDQL